MGEEPKLKALRGGGGESDWKSRGRKREGESGGAKRSLESQVRCLLGIPEVL